MQLGTVINQTTKTKAPTATGTALLQKYGPHTGVYPPLDSPERKAWYAELCKVLEMPPLSELAHTTLTYIRTTLPRDLEEPASEKREMRALLYAKAKAIKLHALGLGPAPVGGMPQYGPTLYWSPELAFKKEVCGSLTAAETAKSIALGQATSAMLHKRARDHRKKMLTKFVAVAGIVAGAIFLGPQIAAAFKGAGAAGAAGSGGAAGAGAAGAGSAASILTPITVTATPIATSASITAAAMGTGTYLPAAALVTAGGSGLTVAGLTKSATAVLPKVIKATNATRTVSAIVKGEVPPPPISLEGTSFTEYGVSIAKQIAEKQLGDKAKEISDAEYANAMREMQADARTYLPPYYSSSPMPGAVPAPVQSVMLGEKKANEQLQTILMFAIPVLMAVAFRS